MCHSGHVGIRAVTVASGIARCLMVGPYDVAVFFPQSRIPSIVLSPQTAIIVIHPFFFILSGDTKLNADWE